MRQRKIAAAVCMLGMLALSLTACGSTDKNAPSSDNGGSVTNGTSHTVANDAVTTADNGRTNTAGTPGNGGAMDTDGDGFIENAADDIGDAASDIADDGAKIIDDVVTGAEDMLDDMTGNSDKTDNGSQTSTSEKNG